MIAIQKIGKSFLGALGYNLKKLNHSSPEMRAELLDHNFGSADLKIITLELNLVKSLRPNLSPFHVHVLIIIFDLLCSKNGSQNQNKNQQFHF